MTRGSAQARRAVRAAMLFGVAALAIGCGSSGSTSGARATRPSASVPGAGAPCSWPTKADKATLNIAYPDTASTYWATSYLLAPGERLEIRGRFPDARYMSFITYGAAGGANSVLTDREIEPDQGSSNPYRDGGSAGGRYSIQVRNDTKRVPNGLSAATSTTTKQSAPVTTAPSAVGAVPSGPVPLGAGVKGAPGVASGTVIYRVYLPKTSRDPTGGAGLPSVSDVHADGSKTAVRTCPHPGANPAAAAIVKANGPATDTPAPAQPVFIRPKQSATNLYPNPDNVYLATILHHVPGQIVVVRGKAPTFPDTVHGVSATGREQVRYWSLCTDEYRKPYPVSFCVADQDVALDAGGDYTIVVSARADRPANATAANGITWLEWGDTSVDNLLLMRHMLAAPTFAESAINVAPGALASSSMGAYAPKGVYCAAQRFAQRGSAGCPTT